MTDVTSTDGAPSAATSSTAGTLAPAAPRAAPATGEAIMAQALIDGGHWTKEQAAAALAADDGEQQDGNEATASHETPADGEQTPFDPYAAVADMKSTLAAVGIEGRDAGAAESIVQKGLTRAPTPEQNAQECGEVQQLLEVQYGKEKAGWMVEWARREFQHLAAANPKLVDLAERSGAGNSMLLIQQLAHRGITRYNRARLGK